MDTDMPKGKKAPSRGRQGRRDVAPRQVALETAPTRLWFQTAGCQNCWRINACCVTPRGNPACRGTFGGRRKAVRDRLALQGGTGAAPTLPDLCRALPAPTLADLCHRH